MIENKAVRPKDIREGVFKSTGTLMRPNDVYLAIQDTTDVTFKNAETQHLKEQGNSHGFIAHSNLIVSTDTGFPVGLIDQNIWLREAKEVRPGKKHEAHGRLRKRKVTNGRNHFCACKNAFVIVKMSSLFVTEKRIFLNFCIYTVRKITDL